MVIALPEHTRQTMNRTDERRRRQQRTNAQEAAMLRVAVAAAMM